MHLPRPDAIGHFHPNEGVPTEMLRQPSVIRPSDACLSTDATWRTALANLSRK
jgi:hypothetical protein